MPVSHPFAGAPGAPAATYLGTQYRLTSTYQAETNYVAGEFYWPVERGQKTSNSDFAAVNGKGLRTMPTDAATMSTKLLLIRSASGPHAMPRNEVAARSSVSCFIAG